MKPFFKNSAVKFCEPAEIGQLKQIWKRCFHDADDVIDFFFEHAYRPESTLVYVEEGAPVSMLTMIPCRLTEGETSRPGIYIYAVATLPEFQGRGIMRTLEESACSFARSQGKRFACLVPQGESLFAMYQKLGYRVFSKISYREYTNKAAPQTEPITFSGLSYSAFFDLRTRYLKTFSSHIRFESEYERFAFCEFERNGGRFLRFEAKDFEGYLCGYVHEKTLEIVETSASYRELEPLMSRLLQEFGADTARRKEPGGSIGYSMIKPLSGEDTFLTGADGYFNFALD